MTTQIFRDSAADRTFRAKWWTGRVVIYGLLIFWAIVALFPIYWTMTTSFKMAPDVMKGSLVPWWDFTPKWLGWKSLGLSPSTIFEQSTVRGEFLRRFYNSAVISVSSSILAVILGIEILGNLFFSTAASAERPRWMSSSIRRSQPREWANIR